MASEVSKFKRQKNSEKTGTVILIK